MSRGLRSSTSLLTAMVAATCCSAILGADLQPLTYPAVVVLVSIETTRTAAGAPDFRYVQPRPDLETSFSRCVASAIVDTGLPVRVIERPAFNAIAFPGVDARNAPRSPEAIEILIGNSEFRRRLAIGGVRFLAVVGGGVRISDAHGAIGCIGGFGAGWCAGALWWDNDAGLSTLVLDAVERRWTAGVSAEASDPSVVGVALIVPFGKPSFVDAIACPKVGASVAGALARMLADPGPSVVAPDGESANDGPLRPGPP